MRLSRQKFPNDILNAVALPNETRRESVYRFFGFRQRLKEKFVNEKVSAPDTPLKDGGTVLDD